MHQRMLNFMGDYKCIHVTEMLRCDCNLASLIKVEVKSVLRIGSAHNNVKAL
jgi:hypothetical protein